MILNLFPFLHFDKFAAMRTGDCVRRLRDEKFWNRYTESCGDIFKRRNSRIPANIPRQCNTGYPELSYPRKS